MYASSWIKSYRVNVRESPCNTSNIKKCLGILKHTPLRSSHVTIHTYYNRLKVI